MPLGQCAILLWPRAASFEPAAAGRVAQRTGPLCVKVAEHAGFEPAGRLRDHGLASRCLGPLGQCSCITSYGYCVKATKNQAAGAAYPLKNLSPREGLEPSTIGFGGRCAANCATEMQKNWQGRQDSNGQPTGSKPAAPPLRDSPITWSGWVDSNHRPLASKARTLTRLRYIQKNCPFKNWCPWGESNSQNLASKASTSASSVTGAKPHNKRGVKLQQASLRLCPHATRAVARTGVAAQGGQSVHIQPRRLRADRKGRGAKAHPK